MRKYGIRDVGRVWAGDGQSGGGIWMVPQGGVYRDRMHHGRVPV